MPEIAIADTSCLILLDNIKEIDLLKKIFHKILITPEIASEFEHPIPRWITVKAPENEQYKNILKLQTDSGEASALALAIETNNAILVLDDYKARKIAAQLNLKYTGTLGLIIKAKESGVIKSVKTILDKIKKTNFRLDENLEREVLSRAKELK